MTTRSDLRKRRSSPSRGSAPIVATRASTDSAKERMERIGGGYAAAMVGLDVRWPVPARAGLAGRPR